VAGTNRKMRNKAINRLANMAEIINPLKNRTVNFIIKLVETVAYDGWVIKNDHSRKAYRYDTKIVIEIKMNQFRARFGFESDAAAEPCLGGLRKTVNKLLAPRIFE
jgi:hypothetical protein